MAVGCLVDYSTRLPAAIITSCMLCCAALTQVHPCRCGPFTGGPGGATQAVLPGQGAHAGALRIFGGYQCLRGSYVNTVKKAVRARDDCCQVSCHVATVLHPFTDGNLVAAARWLSPQELTASRSAGGPHRYAASLQCTTSMQPTDIPISQFICIVGHPWCAAGAGWCAKAHGQTNRPPDRGPSCSPQGSFTCRASSTQHAATPWYINSTSTRCLWHGRRQPHAAICGGQQQQQHAAGAGSSRGSEASSKRWARSV